jgi:hypothetical protein
VECLKAVALLVFPSPFTLLQTYLINISKPYSPQRSAKMKLFRLLLITPFLTATQIHALPATSDSNEITNQFSDVKMFLEFLGKYSGMVWCWRRGCPSGQYGFVGMRIQRQLEKDWLLCKGWQVFPKGWWRDAECYGSRALTSYS